VRRPRYRERPWLERSIAASADLTLEPAASVRAGLRTLAGRATSQGAKVARQSLRSLRRGFDLSRIASVRSRPAIERSSQGQNVSQCEVT